MKQISTSILFVLSLTIFSVNTLLADGIDSTHQGLVNFLAEKHSDEKGQTYFDIGEYYFEEKKFDKALEYFQKAELAESLSSNQEVKLKSILMIAKTHHKLQQYELGIAQFENYLDEKNSIITPKEKASILTDIATNHRYLGNFEEAFHLFFEAIKIQEPIGDNAGLLASNYQLGSLYFYQNNYEEALKYYQKALSLAKELNIKKSIFSGYAAIGSAYDRMENIEKAGEYGLKSYELAVELDSDQALAYSAHNLGSNYLSSKKYLKALEFLSQALESKKKLGDYFGQIGTIWAMSTTYMEIGECEKAIEFLKEGEVIAEKISAKSRLLDVYSKLSEVYESLGEYDAGFGYLKKYSVLKDSVFNENMASKMKEVQTDFELTQKENEIQLLQNQTEINTLYVSIAISSAFFLFFLSLLLFKQNHNQKKTNALLEEKNKEIFKANEKINQQNKELEYSNEELKQFAYVASHDLKEPLRMIGSYTTLLKRRYVNQLDPTAHEFMHYVVDGVSRMENLLNDLLSYSRVNSRALVMDTVNTQMTLSVVANTLQETVRENNASIKINYNNLPEVQASKTHLNQLFQNLISNGLKFKGDAAPIVEVDCIRDGSEYIFSVKDNGIGISKENLDKIFEMFRRLHTKQEYKGSGIGLATCKKIVEKHGGKIWVESEIGHGSTFFFSIPIGDTAHEIKADIMAETLAN